MTESRTDAQVKIGQANLHHLNLKSGARIRRQWNWPADTTFCACATEAYDVDCCFGVAGEVLVVVFKV